MSGFLQAKWFSKLMLNKLNPLRMFVAWRSNLLAWLRFWKSYREYNQLLVREGGSLADEKLFPCIGDVTASTPIEPTYFYQDSWAFEQIIKKQPASHVDIGSHHTFVAFLSKVIPVTMVDIRPLSLDMESIRFKKGTILSLPFESHSLASVSSLCVVEHIGLGRYGDPLDPAGTEKAIAELIRVVSPGGYLYISMPVDSKNVTYFNAHRAFTEDYVAGLFEEFEIVDRRYIYGKRFVDNIGSGFGVACYALLKKE